MMRGGLEPPSLPARALKLPPLLLAPFLLQRSPRITSWCTIVCICSSSPPPCSLLQHCQRLAETRGSAAGPALQGKGDGFCAQLGAAKQQVRGVNAFLHVPKQWRRDHLWLSACSAVTPDFTDDLLCSDTGAGCRSISETRGFSTDPLALAMYCLAVRLPACELNTEVPHKHPALRHAGWRARLCILSPIAGLPSWVESALRRLHTLLLRPHKLQRWTTRDWLRCNTK